MNRLKLSLVRLFLILALLLTPLANASNQTDAVGKGFDLEDNKALKKYFIENERKFNKLAIYYGRFTCDKFKNRRGKLDNTEMEKLLIQLNIETLDVLYSGDVEFSLDKGSRVGYIHFCDKERIKQEKYISLENIKDR